MQVSGDLPRAAIWARASCITFDTFSRTSSILSAPMDLRVAARQQARLGSCFALSLA
jgi:hypothetical protein